MSADPESSSVSPKREFSLDDTYAQRLCDGTYDSIQQQLEKLQSAALANANYTTDFVRACDSIKFIKFKDTSGQEFTTILFGQICHSTYGTRMGAMGNRRRPRRYAPPPISSVNGIGADIDHTGTYHIWVPYNCADSHPN